MLTSQSWLLSMAPLSCCCDDAQRLQKEVVYSVDQCIIGLARQDSSVKLSSVLILFHPAPLQGS